jgi:NAD(P)-dependent dehydrogenase (short-subunit alcohol dehydrogenase family)
MGLATAQLLASRGALLSLADINESALTEAKNSLASSDSHICVTVDVQDIASVQSWIDQTVEKFGKLDGAVNMAGVIVPAAPVTDISVDDWDFVFRVNTRGVFNCLKTQIKAMSAGASIVSRP